jgi:branched-chain amino acid transport system substrate-binding protein
MQILWQFGKRLLKQALIVACALLGANYLVACASTASNPAAVEKASDYYIKITNPYTPKQLAGKNLVRVALLAPFNSSSTAARTEAANLKAAANLALEKYGDGKTILFTIDAGETPQEAANAAKQAISQGADFILGPLFADGVSAAAPFARANNVTLFSFSTDTNEAGDGIYVFSFLPQAEARRIISYAASRGIKNLTLMLPIGTYGDRIEIAAKKIAHELKLNIIAIEKYDPKASAPEIEQSAKQAAFKTKNIGNNKTTAIFIPERGALLRYIVKNLSLNGASTSRVQLLGTGLWNDNITLSDNAMFGGWYVATDNKSRDEFAQELSRKYKENSPTRLAGMGYDAMSLIAQSAKNGDKSAISTRLLERNSGFNGVDGRFRFNDGIIERAMPIIEITGDGTKIIDNAPKNF